MNTSKQNIRFLTEEDIKRIIKAIPDDSQGRRDTALLEVLFSTGLRVSECLNLKRADIKAGKGTLEMSIIGKGGYQRVVYFSPVALQAIWRYLASRNDDDDRLFPVGVRRVQVMVKERAKKAGVDKFISPHVLRHSMATDMLRKGVDIRFVSEFLGHRNLNNTMIYTHVVSSQLKKIHEKIYR